MGLQEGGGEGGQRLVFFSLLSNHMFSNHPLSGLTDAAWNVKANDKSGFIGAAIVGVFLLVVVGWYVGQWAAKKLKHQEKS